MTTNDSTYADRLVRLEEAGENDTVTVPDGWEPSVTTPQTLRNLEPGDRFENDGGDDGMPWKLGPDGLARCGRRWYTSRNLARAGLDVDGVDLDGADEPVETGGDADADRVAALDALSAGSSITFAEPRDFAPGADRNGIAPGWRITALEKEDDGSWMATGVHQGGAAGPGFILRSRHLPALGVTAADFADGLKIVWEPSPRIDWNHVHVGNLDPSKVYVGPAGAKLPVDGDLEGAGFKPLGWIDHSLSGTPADEVDDEDADETDRSVGVPQVPALDEYQLERVAALEHALRILESRTASDETETTAFGVPMRSKGRKLVVVQDMIDVAAFINDGDTGRIDEVQA